MWTPKGLVTHYVLFVISLADRAAHIAGITTHPNEEWMMQVARNMVDEETGALVDKHYLILDRDSKYSERFRVFIDENGTEVIRLPPMSPNLNAYAERFVRSIKEECLTKMIFIGQGSLRRAINEYVSHYLAERNHQGLDNHLIRAEPGVGRNAGVVRERQRLGGMLNYYYRLAA